MSRIISRVETGVNKRIVRNTPPPVAGLPRAPFPGEEPCQFPPGFPDRGQAGGEPEICRPDERRQCGPI